MPAKYRIHPGIGIARLGNSPDAFCISPEEPATLPLECDEKGNAVMSSDGQPVRIKKFKDDEGRIKRQAARFQIYVYDEQSPEGRPLKLGDPVEGGGNAGTLVNIYWRVYLANKKAVWYEFKQLEGENGYAPGHPRRNADVVGDSARQRLIIDPGPRVVDHKKQQRAEFDRDGGDLYAPTFPPPLKPNDVKTLGSLLADDEGRLLVLGGYGNSGSYLYDEFGQPRIDEYANNDGWFDDTSDGPVMARLQMFSELVQANRFVDVEAPAWCVTGYPEYVPEVLDLITADDAIEDMNIRELATRTDIYGTAGTFADPQYVNPADQGALTMWRAGRLRWNPAYKPWFYRDIWSLLFRPDQFSYLCSVLGQSNFPHNQSTRGTFDPCKLGVPPTVDWDAVERCQQDCVERHHSGALFVEKIAPLLATVEKSASARTKGLLKGKHVDEGAVTQEFAADLRGSLARFAAAATGPAAAKSLTAYQAQWRGGADANAKRDLEDEVNRLLDKITTALPDCGTELRRLTLEQLAEYQSGRLLESCRRHCIETNTYDPYRADRQFLFNLVREHGEENAFFLGDKPSSRVYNLPLMPLLAGDNPLSNTLPSKFLRLTDYQFYLLKQWSEGLFYNELVEGWVTDVNLWWPTANWVNSTGRDLDRGVLSNLLGGAFCPGGEIGWIMRNPVIYAEPYRIKADPAFYSFAQTAAQANTSNGTIGEGDYASYTGTDLSQDSDFAVGLQPGDLTKYMALPWQADFNECTTQVINITYEDWNNIYPESENNEVMAREQRVWETLWWPAHRPLQTYELQEDGSTPWLDWSPGVPQTNAGDLKMVTEWWRLSFVVRNPNGTTKPTTVPPADPPPYISVERTRRTE